MINGGLSGVNLLFIALFQLITVCSLIYFSLRLLNKDFRYIGWSWKNWQRDSLLGTLIGLTWAMLQFGLIIPSTSRAERSDIAQMVTMLDGTLTGTISFIALGVIGCGITEEIYDRGYFINVLKDTLGWFDILVLTILNAVLFLYTKRLTASIIAHGIYNMIAILMTHSLYYH